ncbi:MAG TPA: hypothetical protein VGF63_08735 [Solirubrobacteraceae bacterium]|jgi:hypothetical protein
MTSARLRTLIAAATVACCGTFAASASAATYANHVQIFAGDSYFAAPYTSPVSTVSNQSYGTAFSGTWISDSSGVRVSADNFCATAGCTAMIGWSAPSQPSGYGTAENHGNASPSFFQGLIT